MFSKAVFVLYLAAIALAAPKDPFGGTIACTFRMILGPFCTNLLLTAYESSHGGNDADSGF